MWRNELTQKEEEGSEGDRLIKINPGLDVGINMRERDAKK